MKTALLLIDIQNDYFTGGKMELEGMKDAASNAKQLLKQFRDINWPVFHIKHIAKRVNAGFFLPDTTGVEINEMVRPGVTEMVVMKHYPNSFRETNLDELLKQEGIENIIICGAMSHMCIDSTTRAAYDLGYKCTVISDACATKNLAIYGLDIPAKQVHAAYMAGLNGIFSEVVTLAEWNKKSNYSPKKPGTPTPTGS